MITYNKYDKSGDLVKEISLSVLKEEDITKVEELLDNVLEENHYFDKEKGKFVVEKEYNKDDYMGALLSSVCYMVDDEDKTMFIKHQDNRLCFEIPFEILDNFTGKVKFSKIGHTVNLNKWTKKWKYIPDEDISVCILPKKVRIKTKFF